MLREGSKNQIQYSWDWAELIKCLKNARFNFSVSHRSFFFTFWKVSFPSLCNSLPTLTVFLSTVIKCILCLQMKCASTHHMLYSYASWTLYSSSLPGRLSCRRGTGFGLTPCCVPGRGLIDPLHLEFFMNIFAMVSVLQEPWNTPPLASPWWENGVSSAVDELSWHKRISPMYQYPW